LPGSGVSIREKASSDTFTAVGSNRPHRTVKRYNEWRQQQVMENRTPMNTKNTKQHLSSLFRLQAVLAVSPSLNLNYAGSS
jgi:hypothetical protein